MIKSIFNTTFFRLLSAEIIKLRRTSVVWLTIAIALFVPLLKTIIYYTQWKYFMSKKGENPWLSFLDDNWTIIDLMILPFFIVLVSSLVVQIEHKSNAWKYLFVQPVSRTCQFLAKLTIIVLVVLAFFAIYSFSAIGLGYLVEILRPQLGFSKFSPDIAGLVLMIVKSISASLGIIGFQYLLALRFKNFAIPLGIGICGIITAQIIWLWDKSIYFFYAAPVLTAYTHKGMIKPKQVGVFSEHEIYSMIFLIIVLLAGHFMDKRKSLVL